MTENTLRKSIYLRATPKVVWSFLTEPEKLARWFHTSKETLEAGKPLALYGVTSGENVIWGEVREARPFDYLEYTFVVKNMGDHASLVRWWLKEVEGGTLLSLEHSGIPGGEAAFDLTLALDKGWDHHLGQMREIGAVEHA